ncbi:MAG: gliding motility-associated C-terminal domain-containing protein [Saprospiraceae bacterium]|nr:gliding motility-associated C-terminal domain-containing protein [Saprospiraceae bacterium]
MRNSWIVTVVFILTSIFTSPLQAKHIIGGYINYEYLSTSNNMNRYRITLRIFRDCGDPTNGGFDRPAELSIATSDGTYYRQNFRMGNPTVTNLTNLFSNPCIAKPPDVCVQEGVYSATIDLPIDTVRSYYIIYQRCCRNVSIFNIINPGEYGATYYTEITPLAQKLKNSSPTFKTIPPIAICGGFKLIFDHSAEDKDGDSLAYYMVSPLHGGGLGNTFQNCEQVAPQPDCLPPYDSVVYRPPFTGQNPMGGSPRVTINSQTGQLTGTPNIVGQFVVGIRVDEYRNGQLLSSSIRDFQFNVADCEKTVRAELDVNKNKGKDVQFTACGDDILKISNTSTLEASIFDYTWEINHNNTQDTIITTKDLDISNLSYGDYSGYMILNKGLQCSDTATFKFTKFPGLTSDFTYHYDTCKAEGVSFVSLASSDVGLILDLTWSADGVEFGKDSLENYTFPGSDNYQVKLYIRDTNQCVDSLIKTVAYFPVPDKILKLDQIKGCVPALIKFPKLHPDLDATYLYNWNFGDDSTSVAAEPTHFYPGTGDYDITVHVVDQVGCEYDGFFPKAVRIYDVPEAGFDYMPKDLSNIQPNVHFSDKSTDAITWTYYIGDIDSLTGANPDYVFRDTGWVTVRQVVSNQFGCKDTLEYRIDVIPINTIFMPNAFLPASSGDNEEFRPVGNGFGIKEYRMSVYDRYGEEVFRTDNFNQGWNGRDKNGNYFPNGVYGVKVRLVGPRGVVKNLVGKATLIR